MLEKLAWTAVAIVAIIGHIDRLLQLRKEHRVHMDPSAAKT